MTHQVPAAAPRHLDGRHDFDFLFGDWRIVNRKLEDPLAEESASWLQFEATAESRPILGGLGNFDLYTAPHFPGRGNFQGFALRLFDPNEGSWRIWWASTAGNGQLDTPVVGRFADGVGRFECEDTIGARALRVRFEWTDIGSSSARWEQAFSFDGGLSFVPNWIMELTRIA